MLDEVGGVSLPDRVLRLVRVYEGTPVETTEQWSCHNDGVGEVETDPQRGTVVVVGGGTGRRRSVRPRKVGVLKGTRGSRGITRGRDGGVESLRNAQ